MKHEVSVEHKQKMTFEASVSGHRFFIDASEDVGGENKGPRPKQLMLAALAGCTGMDVISILRKMRVEPEYFNVRVEGDVTEEHPKKYERMKVIYEFKGKDLPMDKLEKAVQLSEEKYCGVSAVYKESIKMEHEIKIL